MPEYSYEENPKVKYKMRYGITYLHLHSSNYDNTFDRIYHLPIEFDAYKCSSLIPLDFRLP